VPPLVLCFHLVHANSIRDIRHVQIAQFWFLVLVLIKVEAQMSVRVKDTRSDQLRHAFCFGNTFLDKLIR